MKHSVILLGLVIILIVASSALADIPKRINFQGVLKDTLGVTVPDGNYSLTFRIYDDPTGGIVLWQEADVFAVSGGFVTHLLGSIIPIPETVFEDSLRWLGVQIGSNPEISPRQQLLSVPYSYVSDLAQSAEKLGTLIPSDVALITHNHNSEYAALGHNHDGTYVNVAGPDSVVLSDTGAAFRGRSSGSAGPPSIGIDGIATNTLGGAFGGRFNATSSGVGNPIGVDGTGSSSTSNSAYGGYFRASGGGATYITGVVGLTNSSSSNQTVASYGQATNSSSGTAFGGYFQTFSSGTGTNYGVFGWGRGSSSASTYGSYGTAENTSTGTTYGGYFWATTSGTGTHYGVYGVETAGGSGAAVYAAGDMIASGAKPAVVKTAQGHRLLYAMESPEVWFEDFGEGQLVNGQAHINLNSLFLETVTINASNLMKVFIQLNDPDCKGTAVIRGTTGFDVVELQNGTSNASFSYRIVAKRKGYETQRLMQTDVGMDDPNLYPELWQEIENRHEETTTSLQTEK